MTTSFDAGTRHRTTRKRRGRSGGKKSEPDKILQKREGKHIFLEDLTDLYSNMPGLCCLWLLAFFHMLYSEVIGVHASMLLCSVQMYQGDKGSKGRQGQGSFGIKLQLFCTGQSRQAWHASSADDSALKAG